MPDAFGLYPQPPAPPQQNNMLANPASMLDLALKANQLQSTTQEIQTRNAIGEIYKKNIRPDGSLDEHGAIRDIATNPVTAWRAPEAVAGMLTREGQKLQNAGQGIQNQTAQFQQQASQQKFLADSFSMIDPDKPTEEQLHGWTVMMKRNFPTMPSAMINSMAQTALTDPQGLKHGVGMLRNLALGTGTSERVQGPPDESGAPTTISKGQSNLAPGPGIPTALPPGESSLMEDSAKRFSSLRASAGTSPQNNADLSNLLHDSRILGDVQGPTVEIEKRLNTLAMRAGVKEGFTMGSDKVAAADSFDKIVKQLASNQQKQMSDAGLHIAEGMNPSLAMSTVGREGVINMLRGNQDALDRIRTEASKAKVPAGQYDRWMQDFGSKLDVRVFQFNRMNRDQQQKFLNTMPPEEIPAFEQKYKTAIDSNWVDQLKPAK